MGRACPLCPGSSDVNSFCDFEGIVKLNAEVAHDALDFHISQQQLHGAKIACALEFRRPAGLLLPDDRSVYSISPRSNILDADADDIAASELAIDRQIEQRQITRSPCELELCSNCSHVFRPQRRLGANEITFAPGLTLRDLLSWNVDEVH